MSLQRMGALAPVVEVANGIYLAKNGTWASQPPAAAAVVARLDLPAPDIGTTEQLLSSEEKETGAKQKIIDELGLFGDTKDLFSTAWDIGAGIYDAYNYYQRGVKILRALGALPTPESAETKMLKHIVAKVNEIDKKLDALFDQNIFLKAGEIRGVAKLVQDSTVKFLQVPQPSLRQQLKDALDKLYEEVSGGLLDENASFGYMQYPWSPGKYASMPWYLTMYSWGFEQKYVQPQIKTLGSVATGQGRWDYRPWMGILSEVVTTLIMGHTALDPALKTTGVYRQRFAQFAKGLRATGNRILGGIQVTREPDLLKDWNSYLAGDDPNGIYGGFYYNFIADGWPVGAVDSVTGASVFSQSWVPAENGFPGLESIRDVPITPPNPPPWPWTLQYQAALKKADSRRQLGYFILMANSPVPEIFALASLFEDMAKPPKSSETVTFEGPDWSGVRYPAGTVDETIGGVFCEEKTFTADVYHVQRQGEIKVRIQTSLFGFEEQKLNYRVFLETYPLNDETPDVVDRLDLKELPPGTGSASLEAFTFYWDVEKALQISDSLEADNHVYVVDTPVGGPRLLYDFYASTSGLERGTQPIRAKATITTPFAAQPLKEQAGLARNRGKAIVSYTYERQDADGEISITLRGEAGQRNAVVWLVVEEDVGFSPGTKPLRTSLRLAMILEEHHWPWGYFAHKKYCDQVAIGALKPILVYAAERHLAVPEPVPHRDLTLANYVSRLKRELRIT